MAIDQATNGTMTEGKIKKVIIVGAGPSGLLLAIMLAKANIKVQLVEANFRVDDNPRAAHYAPSAVYDFERAGVLDEVNAQGFHPDAVCWRKPDGEFIAGISMGHPKDVQHPMVVLPLDKLGPLFLNHLSKLPNAEVLMGHRVVGLEQDESQATVKVQTADGERTLSADYVVGADGANSAIRKGLFGNEYPGETLPQQIIASNVYYDFKKHHGWWDSNFIVHETDWYMAAKISDEPNGGLWRVTYGDIPDLTKEEYLKRQPMRYEQFWPPLKPGTYKLTNASPYKLQQRCAKSFRVGRFILVADAAHLCNPFGGMGLTGGFADVGSLYDCLKGINEGLLEEDILDKYSDIRIKIWKEMIDPISRGNFKRLWAQEAIPEREQFFKMCDDASKDPELAKNFALVCSSLRMLLGHALTDCRLFMAYGTTSHSTTGSRRQMEPAQMALTACIRQRSISPPSICFHSPPD